MLLRLDREAERLREAIENKRVVRGVWKDCEGGACLLSWLSFDSSVQETAKACPGDIMPLWMAYFTVWLNDTTSVECWPQLIARYAELVPQWHVLDDAAWRDVRVAMLISIVDTIRTAYPETYVRDREVLDRVAEWLRAPDTTVRFAIDTTYRRDESPWRTYLSALLNAVMDSVEDEAEGCVEAAYAMRRLCLFLGGYGTADLTTDRVAAATLDAVARRSEA